MTSADTRTSTDRADADFQRYVYIFLAGLFVWRVLFVLLAPLDLAPDEAYYWDWSRIPDWGYYSKPPMVAWINIISRLISESIAGESTVFAVRFPAVLLTTVSLWILFALTKRLFDARTGFWAALAAAASPGNCALGLLMTIDAPLVCAWSLALYAAWRAVESEQTAGAKARLRWWAATALCMGVGILSKQMMLVFPVLLLAFLAASPPDRFIAKTPRVYFSILAGLAFLLPVFYWNAVNDWITIQHTAHHFEGNTKGGFFFLITFSEFVGSQFLLISPITFLLFACVSGALPIRFSEQTRPVRLLLLFSLPVIVVITLMSLRQRVHPNWPAVFYPAGMVLTAAWATGRLSAGERVDRMRKLFVPGIVVGAILALTTYLLPFTLAAVSADGGKYDPTRRLKGWRQMGETVGAVLERTPRPERTFLLAESRQHTAALAFYVPGQPRVFKWTKPESKPDSQYDIWPGPVDRLGWDALIVMPQGHPLPEDLARAFERLESLGDFDVPMGGSMDGTAARKISLYLGHALQRWNF